MLDLVFQNLLRRISEVSTAHLTSKSDDESMKSLNWEFIFSEFDGWLVLQTSAKKLGGGYWLFPTLVPSSEIETLKKKLPHFSIHPSSAAYSHVMSYDDHYLEPYWNQGTTFDESEIQLFFNRRYEGRPRGKENYVEFNQLVTHPLGLHWSPSKNSFCTLDSQGEEIEKIKMIETDDLKIILIRRRTLDKLLYLGKWVLVRYLSFTRWNGEHPHFDDCINEEYIPENYDGKFEVRSCPKSSIEYVEFRGAQIESPHTPKEEVLSWKFEDEEEEKKKYANFVVEDWKNKRILKDYSLDPTNFSNYLTKSDLPYEMSTIYFKAEVLDKYKNNPDKFKLQERSIECRGGWYLDTYDVNEHRQVHTYAIYLSRLPYKEQLHWAQYNEEKKGPLSKRAVQTDFEAKWPDTESKIEMLKNALTELSKIQIGTESSVWGPKGGTWENASKGLHYLHTENANQWHDFIIALANTTNEGFQLGTLRQIAEMLGISTLGQDKKPLGTLGLIRALVMNVDSDKCEAIHGVLNDLQKKRGMGKAHGTWETPAGSLILDADERFSAVIQAIVGLKKIIEHALSDKS